MSTISQKQAVVEAVAVVLGDSFIPNETIVSDILTKEQKVEVRGLVLEGIMNGTVGCNKDTEDSKEINKYVNSMVDNHLRKAKTLNGSTPYKPSKKGTRRDEKLKELTKLKGQFTIGSDQYLEIEGHILERNNELDQIRAEKKNAAAVGTINAEVLPPHLRNLVNANGSANITPDEV